MSAVDFQLVRHGTCASLPREYTVPIAQALTPTAKHELQILPHIRGRLQPRRTKKTSSVGFTALQILHFSDIALPFPENYTNLNANHVGVR